MASTNAPQKIQEVINLIRQLAENSKLAASNITTLETMVNKLANVKVENFKTFSKDLSVFLSYLKEFGMVSSNVEKVESALKSLGNASLMQDFNKNFDKANQEMAAAQKIAAGYAAELKKLQDEMKSIGNLWQKTINPKSGAGGWSALGKLDLQSAEKIAASLPPDAGKQLLADYTRVRNILEEIKRLQNLVNNPPGERPYTAFAESLAQGKKRGTGELMGGQQAPQIVGAEFIKSLGLTASGAERLQKKLNELDLSGARVLSSFKDLNTGMTHVKIQADSTGGGIKKFTAVLDNSGNIVNTTQNRYRSFASGIARDIVEVLKWSIAIGAVYGPIKKLNELLEESRKIQTDLIDVQISLGKATADLQGVFDASVDIANQTSSAVEGVIEGYTLAVAAAGSVSGESERLATTQILVRDSMVLAKLAGIQQKEALDTLVGALRQAELELTDGMKLLDSWVAVSRNANVTINQLASTFAIVGSAAEDVGLSYSQLNALSATMAETTKLSADEVGNAIRGIIATMQTDKAMAEFSKYGLATKGVTGELRNMMDILRELSILQQAGVLDEKAMGALTQAGGGGARRGAQLSAIVSNMSRVSEIVSVSEAASGDAAEALELKMSTLESAIQRLNNSFSALAQSLGMEGGVIGGMTAGVEVITKMIDGVKELVSMLKWAAPILGGAGFLKLLGGTQTGSRFLGQQLPQSLARFLVPTLESQNATGQFMPGVIPGATPVEGFAPLTNALIRALQSSGIGAKLNEATGKYEIATVGGLLESLQRFLDANGRKGVTPGSLLTPALLMATSLGEEDKGRLTTQAIGTGAGILLAELKDDKSWVGIGAVIATAFYEKFLTFDEDIVKELIVAREDIVKPGGDEQPRAVSLQSQFESTLSWWEKFQINFRKFGTDLAVGLGSLYEGMNIDSALTDLEKNLSQTTAALSLSFGDAFDEETKKAFQQLWTEYLIEAAQKGLSYSAAETLRIENIDEIKGLASDVASDLLTDAINELSKGTSGSIQRYLELRQAPQQYATSAGSLITAQQLMVREGLAQPSQVSTQGEALSLVSGIELEDRELLSQLTADITQSITGIQTLSGVIATTLPQDVVDRWQELANTMGILAGLEFVLPQLDLGTATAEQIEDWTNQLNGYITAIRSAGTELPRIMAALQSKTRVLSAGEKLMPIVDIPDDLTSEQRQQLLQKAQEMWEEYFKLSGVSEEEMDEYIKAQQDQLIRANNEILGITTKIPEQFLGMAAEDLNLGGAGAGASFNLMDLRDKYDTASFNNQLIPRYMQVLGAIQRNFPQYQVEGADTGFILEDGFATQHVDMTLLQLAMQDLIEINREKGLEGIYNLPEGATFMIPVQAFELDRETRFGMETMRSEYRDDIISGQAPAVGTGKDPGEPSFPEYKTSIEDMVAGLRDIMSRRTPELDTGKDPGEAPFPDYATAVQDLVTNLRELGLAITNAVTTITTLDYSGISRDYSGPTTQGEPFAEVVVPTATTGPAEVPFDVAEGAISAAISATTPEETPPPTLDEKVSDFFTGFSADFFSVLAEIAGAPAHFAEAFEETPVGQFMSRRLREAGVIREEQPVIGEGTTGIVSGAKGKGILEDLFKFSGDRLEFPEKMKTTTEVQQMAPAPVSLTLDIESTSQLIVDGRTLATVIKPYLYADLLRFSASSNSAINRNVVA